LVIPTIGLVTTLDHYTTMAVREHSPSLLSLLLLITAIGTLLATTSSCETSTHIANIAVTSLCIDIRRIFRQPLSSRDAPSNRKRDCMIVLLIIIAGDVSQNPGPGNKSIFPCGLCEQAVKWNDVGVCCNNCSLWYHKSCGDISSKDLSYLEQSSVIWHCYKCNSVNIDSVTFNSFELSTTNAYAPLSDLDSSVDSVTSQFCPQHTTSQFSENRSRQTSSASESRSDHTHYKQTPASRNGNLRIMTINCCSVRANQSEFRTAIDYVKPDIICGTESWLKGIRPGTSPSPSAIQNSEIFPDSYVIHRNDRNAGAGGGVSTAISKKLASEEHPELVTDCEIVWSKIKLKNKKDLYVSTYYMPHRNITHINRLSESVNKLTINHPDRHWILAGDFNVQT
jgi:hypothetical protein